MVLQPTPGTQHLASPAMAVIMPVFSDNVQKPSIQAAV